LTVVETRFFYTPACCQTT